MEAKQSAPHTGCFFFWSWILMCNEVWPLLPNKPETERLSSHARGKICSETPTGLHELLNYSSGSFYVQGNMSGYYFKCITSEEERIFGPCRVEAHSRCWTTFVFPVPDTGAFKRQNSVGVVKAKPVWGWCWRVAERLQSAPCQGLRCVAAANYKSQSPKQNVCCVNWSAGINEAVCAARSGCMPLIINGTTEFGMQCGGPDRWPYDLSTCVLSLWNITSPLEKKIPSHVSWAEDAFLLTGVSLQHLRIPALEISLLIWKSLLISTCYLVLHKCNRISTYMFTLGWTFEHEGLLLEDRIDCNYLSPWGEITAHL